MNFKPKDIPVVRRQDAPPVSAAEMRKIDRIAQMEFDLQVLQIMENAGRSLAYLVREVLGGRASNQRIMILAGPGNNGGGALCALRHLRNWGVQAYLALGAIESEMSTEALTQLHTVRVAGYDALPEGFTDAQIDALMHKCEFLVDGLIGYGLEGPPPGALASLITMVNQARKPVLALDVPSGLNGTTGKADGAVVKASATLALGLPKRGLFVPEARDLVGEVFVADIGLPPAVYSRLNLSVPLLFAESAVVRLKL